MDPVTATFLIGISDTPYIRLEDTSIGQVSTCTFVLTGEASTNTNFDCQCQPGSTGRYVYVYMDESVEYLYISEVQIYGDPELGEGM